MKDEKIPIGKCCATQLLFREKVFPKQMRAGKIINWNDFLKLVQNASANVQEAEKKDTKRYRLLTGTYKTKQHAENAMDVLKHRFGWVCYLEQDQQNYRVKTGTFQGKADAEKAKEKVINAKVASVVYIIEA